MKLVVSEGTSLYDSSVHIVQKPFVLTVTIPPKTGDFFYCYELNGKYKQVYIDGGRVEIQNLEAGELHATVKHCIRDVVVREYPCEALILTDLDGTIKATPEIDALRSEFSKAKYDFESAKKSLQNDLKTEQDARKKLADAFDEYKKDARAKMAALVLYAYYEYEGDLQLNAKDLSIDKFAALFGVTLTDEEKALFSKEEL